jgi:RHS repeat-associated protein
LVFFALTASLLSAGSVSASAAEPGGKPSVQKTRSADVTRVGASSPKTDDQTSKAAKPRPEPVFPADGEAAIVPVDGSWSSATDLGVSVRSEDPVKAPTNIAVKVVGQSSEAGVGGGGLVLEVTPTKDTAAAVEGADDPTASPSPEVQPTASPDASSLTTEPTEAPEKTSPTPEPEPEPDPAAGAAVKPETGFTGSVEVRVDYSKFATASGGDWASRLKLMLVEDCKPTKGKDPTKKVDCEPATATPKPTNEAAAGSLEPTTEEAATATALKSTNDTEQQTVSAVVPAETLATGSPTMFAVAAADSGATGTYAATPLNPASSWSAGSNSGDFSWSYPIPTPPGVNGPAPDLSINYSSSSVDGRTRSKNSQTSWVGEGFALDPGYIERTYRTCAADNTGTSNAPVDSQDLCWVGQYLDISLGGKTSKLVRVGSGPEYRLHDDDGTRVKRVTSSFDNRAKDGEHWEVTTPDGTRYYYGKVKRFATDTETTNSVSTVPVYGNNDGDPCHQSSFKDSNCRQAWRWGLDYVVDTNGNTMSLFYRQETNYFGSLNNADGEVKEYDRAQHLKRIEYGTNGGSNQTAPARVMFDLKPRCLDIPDPNGFTCEDNWREATKEHWPDSPRDRVCTSGTSSSPPTSCSGRVAPTFFTPNRLGSITTEVHNGTGYDPVNSWTLKHLFPETVGDSTDPSLWLDQITPSGKVGPNDIDLRPVTFGKQIMDNRVDKDDDNAPPFVKYRVNSIDNGTGGTTLIEYSGKDCSPSNKPSTSSLHDNERRCFPVWYSSDDVEEPRVDFFHKYVVDKVTESDGLDGSPDVVTNYQYNSGGAWRFYDDKALHENYRTWGQWRGFGSVSTRVGSEEATQSYENTMYLRGMDGNPKQGGGEMQVDRADTTTGGAEPIEDLNRWEGFVRRTRTTLGPGSDGEVVDVEINEPWSSPVTASYGDQPDARIVDVAWTETKTHLGGGSFRTAKVSNTYNTYGQPTQVEDHGNTSTDDDNTCTNTSYAQNLTKWILELPSVETTTAGKCADSLPTATNVLASARTYYDGQALGVVQVGNVTESKSATGFLAPGGITYQTDATFGYDIHGRVTSDKNALSEETKTAFTPTTGGLPTQITETNPKKVTETNPNPQTIVTKLNKAWGTPDQVKDVAGGKTDYEYDALGRVTKIWVPGREKSAPDSQSQNSPTHKFSYTLASPPAQVANVVKSEQLQFGDDTYVPTFTFYDGLLRERGTQTAVAGSPKSGAAGGRLVTEKIYDAHGRVAVERGPQFNDEAPQPNSNLVTITDDTKTEAYTKYTYDRADRVTNESFWSKGNQKWETTTSYGGDRISVTPPEGGTPTTTVFDVRGQTTKLRQYNATTPTGTDYDDTDYTYTLRGELATIKNAAGNEWTNKYNIRGNLTEAKDPDRGITTTQYDELDRPQKSTDAKNQVLWTTYDELGRKVELHDDSPSGNLRSKWVYDTEKPGLLTSSTRYIGGEAGDAYTSSVEEYDAAGRPKVTKLTIPASEGELSRPGGYVETTSYLDSGLVDTITPAAAPGLPGGALQFDYDLLGNPIKGPGVTDVTYSPYGDVKQRILGSDPNQVFDTRENEAGTRRLKTHTVNLAGANPQEILDQQYGYDDAGNITSLNDIAPGGDESSPDTDKQCFTYDYLRRLKDAWSSEATTCGAPTDTTLGSVAPYWDSYTYDKSGNRKTWVAKTKPGSTVETTTHNYTVPAGNAPRPHATTKDAATGDNAYTEDFEYDANGSMTGREKGTGGQDITWDAEGHQATVTDKATGKKTEYLYDADGNRLIERDQTADSTTLYVGATEYVLKDNAVTAVRNLDLGGEPSLTQTAAGDQYVIGDAQSTGMLQIDASNLAFTKRRFSPFGGTRDVDGPGWDGGRGFLNKPADPTGTTHLGAREYDPGLGRFLSVDPVLDPMDPQQGNGYAYANNSPITMADPDGLIPDCGGGCGADRNSPTAFKWRYSNGKLTYNKNARPGNKYYRVKKHPMHRAAQKFTKALKARQKKGGGAVEVKDIQVPWLGKGLAKLTFGQHWASQPHGLSGGFGMSGSYGSYHDLLDALGMTPVFGEPIDGLNALLYLLEGDHGNAAISVGGMAIGAGSLGTGARLLKNSAKGACSFTGSTAVLMADGSQRPIEDVEVGDKVIATNPETGEQRAKTVEHVWVHDDTVIDLVIDGEVITTTEDHPFWSVTDRRFERADELGNGERVISADGSVVRVSGLQLGTARQAMTYNLTVEGIHTFHVGQSEILVHNTCNSLKALNDPKAIEGLTPSQVDDLARNAGFESKPGKLGAANPATRYYKPGTNQSEGFRVLPRGVSGQPGIKSGPYLRYFGGPNAGQRVPLGDP